jgi:hypothetical protein
MNYEMKISEMLHSNISVTVTKRQKSNQQFNEFYKFNLVNYEVLLCTYTSAVLKSDKGVFG